MPISPRDAAALSNAAVPSTYNNISPIPVGGYPLGTADPNSTIQYHIDRLNFGADKSFVFPTDLPKFHFTIAECDYRRFNPLNGSGAGNITPSNLRNLETEKRYKLPLPYPLTDSFQVNYDDNFSYLSTALEAASAFGSRIPTNNPLGSALGGGVRGGAAALGITLNQFKTITMSSPSYRTFQFSWKLAPKNFAEAQTIQRIVMNLRKGMSPSTIGTDNLSKAFLHFPKIYVMYFSPNVKYLYKFKPAVLRSIVVDYQGGNPLPAFYKPYQGVPNESPPESVQITTDWLELEYWLDSRTNPEQSDYKFGADGLPTDDPFDAWNFYTIDGQGGAINGSTNTVGR